MILCQPLQHPVLNTVDEHLQLRAFRRPPMPTIRTPIQPLKHHRRLLRRLKNSSRVLARVLMQPNIQLVVVLEPGFCTPLMTMHKCSISTTTATPSGFKSSAMARATCLVSLSCTWSLRENISASLASFERPRTLPLGM